MTRRSLVSATVTLVSVAALAAFPLLLLAHTFAAIINGQGRAPGEPQLMDFHTFWQAGRNLLHGIDPYPAVSTLGAFTVQAQQSFVYPAPMAGLFAGFALLPFPAAAALYTILLTGAIAAGMWLLDVRDWRCYGAVFMTPPVLSGIHIGAISGLLLLGAAAAWRWRRTPWVCGLAVAAVIVAKLFLWPLLLWLLVSRRYRAFGWAAAASAATMVAGWAWVGFSTVTAYPDLLRRISTLAGPYTYQPAWQLFPSHAAVALEAAAAVAAGLYLRFGRSLDDSHAYTLAILLALALSPIVWLHYFVLLIPVIAVRQPRLAYAWLIPATFMFTMHLNTDVRALIASAILVALAAPLRRNRAERHIQRRSVERNDQVAVRQRERVTRGYRLRRRQTARPQTVPGSRSIP